MGWRKRIIISGGELEGSIIGISDNMATTVLPATVGGLNRGESDTIQSTSPHYYNTDLEKQINVSSYFTLDHADFSDECFAEVSILDENDEISGYFSLYATRNGMRVEVVGKVKNASGVVVGTFRGPTGVINMDSRVNPTCYLCFCETESDGKTYYGWYFNLNQMWTWMGRNYSMACYAGAYICDDDIYDYWGIAGSIGRNIKETSPEFGPAAKTGGGYNEDTPASGKGSFDDSSDIITPSSKPTLTPLSSNLVHAYKVNVSKLNDIADAIYVDLANDWSSIETALEAIFNAIFAAKYVDYLLDLLILPVDVPAPNLVNVKVGGKYLTLSSGRIQANLVTDPYVDFDCGSITIPEYWANFLDYTGTKVKLFLPYIGYIDIQPEYIISGELNVKYRFNVLDGSFIVYVMSSSGKSELTSSMIGQYAGVAAVHVPLQASDYATKVSGLISAIGTVAAGMAAGGVGAMTGAANLGNTLMQKPGSTHANGYNASSSYLSHRCPYLIIERQVSQFSQKYPEEVGLPLNVMRTLGSMQGLTKCEAAHLDTIPCSIEGKEKIRQMMLDGIIL